MVSSIHIQHEQFYPALITLVDTLKWLQVPLSNTNSFICTQLNGFKHCYITITIKFNISHLFVHSWILNSFIWSKDGTLTGTTTPCQSWSRSNGNEGVLHIPRTSSLTIRLFSVTSKTLVGSRVIPSVEMQSAYSKAPAEWADPKILINNKKKKKEKTLLEKEGGRFFFMQRW